MLLSASGLQITKTRCGARCARDPWPQSVLTWSKDTSRSERSRDSRAWRQTPQAGESGWLALTAPAFCGFCIYRLISCLSRQLPWVLSSAMWTALFVEERNHLSPGPSSVLCFVFHMPKKGACVLGQQLCLTCLGLLGFPVLIILFGLDGW